MPEIKPSQIEQQKTVISPHEKREEIFDSISNVRDYGQAIDATELIFEHSIEDGLKLSDRLGLGDEQLAHIAMSSAFALKHPEVFKLMVREATTSRALKDIRDDKKHKSVLDSIMYTHDQLITAEKSGDWSEISDEIAQQNPKSLSEGLGKEIDNYYAPLLTTREFKPRNLPSEYPIGESIPGIQGEKRQLKSAEELADEALLQLELMMQPAYYATTINATLERYLAENSLSGESALPTVDIFVVPEQIKAECRRLGIPYGDVETRLKSARYTSITAGIKKGEAERGVLSKLNKSLSRKGQKAELKDDRYEVVEDKEGRKKEKKEEFDYWDQEELISTDEVSRIVVDGVELAMQLVDNNQSLVYYIYKLGFVQTAIVSDKFPNSSGEVSGKILKRTIVRKGTKLILEYEDNAIKLVREIELHPEVIDKFKQEQEKEKSDYWSTKEEFNGDVNFPKLRINGVDLVVVKGLNDSNSWYAIDYGGHFIRVSTQFNAGNIIKKISRKGELLTRLVEMSNGKTIDQEIHLYDREIDEFKKKIEKEKEESKNIEAEFVEKGLLGDIYKLGGIEVYLMKSSGGTQQIIERQSGLYITKFFPELEAFDEMYYENEHIIIAGKTKKDGQPITLNLKIESPDPNENITDRFVKLIEGEKEDEKTEEKEFDFDKFEDKALDYIEKFIDESEDAWYIAKGLAGLDSDRAWKLRDKLLEMGVDIRDIVEGIAGLDSDQAWKLRDKLLFRSSTSDGIVAISLAGLDSDQAWKLREQLFKKGEKGSITLSLSGLDSDRAWKMREKLIQDNVNHGDFAAGLAGLDSERAWQMRERLFKNINTFNNIAESLAGLDSDRAWQMRDQLFKKGEKGSIALSLSGLDSDRAWKMRDKVFEAGEDKSGVALSLAGLDSDRAWKMREQLFKEREVRYVAHSLAGDNVTFVWQLKLDKKKKQAAKLNKEEQEKLKLLNLLHSPDLPGITEHFSEELSAEEKAKKEKTVKKKTLSGSALFSGIINKLIKKNPQPFLETMPAKRDRLPYVFAEQLAFRIFPEIKREQERNAWRGFAGYGGLEGPGPEGPAGGPEDYLNPSSGMEMIGGGAEDMDDNREVMEFRDALGQLIVTNILGKYDASSRRWLSTDFAVDAPLSEPTIETTATLPNIKNLSQVSLPKPLESNIIPERVKGLDAKGKEYDLKASVSSSGEARVAEKPKAVEKIVYSLAVSAAPAPMAEISGNDYERFKHKLESVGGGDLTSSLASLPEDLELDLLAAIKDKEPKDQVTAIERLVRDLGHYDFNNQEVSRLKAGKPLEEQLYIMEQRLEELKSNKPGSAEKLKGKRFAGVCADFAQITAILLRRAGFASGIVAGFSGVGKKIAVKHAHATSFVVWPDETGKNRAISIDGTPDGVVGISLPSLVEREQEAERQEKEMSKTALAEIESIISGLKNQDTETVRRMSNGELERIVNNILKYQVKESHLAIIERLFEHYLYTPVHNLDLNNPKQKGEILVELAGAVERQRKRLKEEPEKDTTPAGNRLMQMMQDFLRRFSADEDAESKDDAFAVMEKIVELVQNDLNEVEQKSAFAVLAYLKAKNISGNKK
ncbi:MAG: hypothetical protein Q7K65_04760 [Candidatus Buchananbacteria bacterium]|nr:hypothetical protein [Candidatus Buchananbacteria bacterium]